VSNLGDNSLQPDPEPLGLVCNVCGCRHFYTRRTKKVRDGRIMRERECRHCHKMYKTYEQASGEAW
jgi:transcriptional regulator NrdR family protein